MRTLYVDFSKLKKILYYLIRLSSQFQFSTGYWNLINLIGDSKENSHLALLIPRFAFATPILWTRDIHLSFSSRRDSCRVAQLAL